METTSFKNRNWNRLLSEIEDQKIIPIVGPELLIMELDDRQILYYDYIAQKLIEKLNIDTDDFPIQYGLSDVAVAFIKAHGDPADIYFEIREIINSRNWTIPEPLKLLSEIGHFNLFLSITFDSFMEQALNSTRFGGNKKTLSIVYSNRGKVTDLPLESTSECVVFQLFGKASSAPDYAVTEDDLLLFNHRLQSQDQQPLNLFDRLKSNYLLTMGCSFQDWLARFFFCATKGDVLFSDVGMRGVIVDKKTITDEPLNKFLKRRKTLIYPKGNAAEFVKELHHRWTERYRNIYRPSETKKNTYKDESNPFIPEAAFLSYASEDKDFAISIKAALESVGVDVWFDQQRLEAGDDFELKILKNISNCSIFFPIISKNTLKGERRFFRLEWHEAIKESRFRPIDIPFIQPLVIDNIPYDNPNIPNEFNKRHWQQFPGETIPPEFLSLTRQRIRELRRRKRNL